MSTVQSCAALLCLIAGMAPLRAAEKSSNLEVGARIVAGCTAGQVLAGETTFGTLDFGLHALILTPIDLTGSQGAGAIRLSCTGGLPWRVVMNYGAHAASGQRRMHDSGSGYVNYQIYSDSARTAVWDDVVGVSGTGDGLDQWLPVFARVPAPQVPTPGTYTDTVQVVVSW
jgi:spore coat protein U-like protein